MIVVLCVQENCVCVCNFLCFATLAAWCASFPTSASFKTSATMQNNWLVWRHLASHSGLCYRTIFWMPRSISWFFFFNFSTWVLHLNLNLAGFRVFQVGRYLTPIGDRLSILFKPAGSDIKYPLFWPFSAPEIEGERILGQFPVELK